MTRIAPSGEQFEITCGRQRATIVEVGGGIREYAVADRHVLDPYPLAGICDGGHGTPLIPWPNRLGDGRYRFDGLDYQVALSEPAHHNAIHGFLRWRPWQPLERQADTVVMGARLHPLPGYPFALDVRLSYQLDDAGLTVATSATNIGERACPYGAGQHPYLSPGTGLIDECSLQLPGATRLLTDEERKLPIGQEAVHGTRFDFRQPRRLGELRMDCAFTDLDREDSGVAVTRLWAPDGSCVEHWVDAHYPILEIYTGDTLAPSRRRRGLAVEPMTCPPNAFQSGQGVLRLEPGQTVTASWGARLL